jgi:glycosyltransferase involved in cell wall biosynthesis
LAWLFKDVMAYPKFDAIVGVGPRIAEDLRGFPYKHFARISSLRTIPNGIDTSLFQPDERTRRQERAALQIDPAVRVAVSVSRLHKQKGVDLSLEAVAKLMDGNADVRYFIAGDGPERASLETLAASLGIADRVTFVGALTRERLAALLCACDVMLFTSTRIEGLPLNVLEALACGIPAVLSEHLYDEEIFGATVVPVPPADTSKVAAGLARALQFDLSPGSRLPRGFSLQECARAYLELFEEIAARLA